MITLGIGTEPVVSLIKEAPSISVDTLLLLILIVLG